MMLEQKIQDVLGPQTVLRMSVESSVTDAAKKMAEKHVGAMLVCKGEDVCGIFTERDMLERVIAPGLAADKTTLGDVMTPDPVSVTPRDTLLSAVFTMKQQLSRHLLVKEDEEVVGIISVRDILRSVVDTIAEDQQRLDHLWQGFPV